MSEKSVEDRVKEIIAEVLEADVNSIKDETRFVEDLHIKSPDVLELIAALEDEFGIEITLAESMRNKTVKDAIECVKRKLQRRTG